MNHIKVGRVYNLSLTNEGNFADILVKRQTENDSPLVLGQFVVLATNDTSKLYIGTVESENPDFSPELRLKDAIINSIESEKEIDDLYKNNALLTSYRCRMIGICYDSGKEVKYYSNVRTFPAPTSLSAYVPSNDFMNNLFLSAVNQGDNETKDIIFEIGKLQYGTDHSYTKDYKIGTDNEVKVQFNATNLLRKRTAIFGKSGYGKSNTVKTVIGMMTVNHPNCGQLILDTNGEYALDNDQNEGLMDIFHEAGFKSKCVLYTNREVSDKHRQKFGAQSIKALKFDVYDQIKPAFEIIIANLDRQEPLYLNPWTSSMDGIDDENKLFDETNSPALVWAIWYACLEKAGIYPINPTHKKKPLTLNKKYISSLMKGAEDAGELPGSKVYTDEELDTLAQVYGFVRSGSSLQTNSIEEMIKYANWYMDDLKEKKNDSSSMKGFIELAENPRRLYALKSFNYTKDDVKTSGMKSISLGESVLRDLKANKIVILDMASVSIRIAKTLSQHILGHLLNSASKMFGDYKERDLFKNFDVLVYIEEAQNYLKPEEVKNGSIYERVAKEGRKFHIGLVYVTQQPSAIDPSITSQTENIIAMHMSNGRDCYMLNEIKDKFDRLTCKFLKDEAQKGLAYVFAEPHQPFVLPCQIHKFDKELILKGKKK